MSNDGFTGPQHNLYGEQPAQQPSHYGQHYQQHYAAPYADGAAPARPKSVDLAVTLMRVGALLSLLGIVLVFVMGDAMREAVETSLQGSGLSATSAEVDAAVALGTGFAVVMGLLGVALWLWMAHANGKGRGWARITATVFFGIYVLSTLASFAQPAPALSRVAALVQLALGAVIVVLLWKKESSAWFTAMSRRP